MSKRIIRNGFALLATLALAFPTSLALAEPYESSVNSSSVHRVTADGQDSGSDIGTGSAAATRAERRVNVIVTLHDTNGKLSLAAEKANLRQQAILLANWQAKYGIKVKRQVGYLINGFSGSVPAKYIESLKKEPEVATVEIERVYYRLENTARVLQGVTQALEASGLDGTGMVVSIVDSGIDITHPDLQLNDAECAKAKIKTIQPGMTCKVPAGHNYADENETVSEIGSAEQHGMHVAGIVASNGTIKGVAPKAQILAMKVFSNDPEGGGASESDILAAIEDSVKLGADVINLSLGSTNGINVPSTAISKALANARTNGVLPVVAAGNEGQNFSPTGTLGDIKGMLDDGTVGSPASYTAAFTIASVENGVITGSVLTLDFAGEERKAPYMVSAGEPDDQAHEIVYVGIGRAEDFAQDQDLAGKWALIERGKITFADKVRNAKAHGATGVLLYNHAEGGNELFGAGGLEGENTPVVSVGHDAGVAAKESLEAGNTTTVRISGEIQGTDNPAALEPSEFTSWGTNATLDFKPELAGIGGNVYSLQNDGQYGSMSGTSMASPNVAGISALLLQSYNKQGTLSKAQRLERAAATLTNTAEILVDENNIPYSPRQIGAGLAQIDRAVKSKVTATVDNVGTLALREITGTRSFTVNIHNYGEETVEFTVPEQKVYTETNTAGENTRVVLANSTLGANKNQVSVAPGQDAEVTFTLTPNDSQQRFLEGWVKLESNTEGQPNISLPYFGFYGDWNQEPIMATKDNPVDAQEMPKFYSQLYSTVSGGQGSVALESENVKHWVSPNSDGNYDTVSGAALILRNAEEIRYAIYTEDGQLVRELGAAQEQPRLTVPKMNEFGVLESSVLGPEFSGQVWDAQQNDYAPVAEGNYVYRISARLHENSPYQSLDLPFGIDYTKPELSVGEKSADGTVIITVTDALSGLEGAPEVKLNGTEDVELENLGNGQYRFNAGSAKFVVVKASDLGKNTVVVNKVFEDNAINIYNKDEIESTLLGNTNANVVDGGVNVTGVVGGSVAKVTVNGEEVPLQNGEFTTQVPLADGANTIPVVGFDAAGNQVAEDTLTVNFDEHPPVVEFSNADEFGDFIANEDGSVTVTGRVSQETSQTDPHDSLSLTINETEVPINNDGSFTATIPGPFERNLLTIVASDGVNETIVQAMVIDENQQPALWSLTNMQCISNSICLVDPSSEDTTDDSFTIRGYADEAVTRITFTPGLRAGEGSFVNSEPIVATFDEERNFSAKLPLHTGINNFRFRVETEDGVVVDRHLRFYYDTKVPSLHFDEPILKNGKLYLKAPGPVRFTGNVSDDGFGYNLTINGNVIEEVSNALTLGPDYNGRNFDRTYNLSHNDTLIITASDLFENSLSGKVKVEVDDVAPTVEFEPQGVTRVETPTTYTFTATDLNLESFELYVDGQKIERKDFEVTEAALETVLEKAVESSEEENTEGNTDSEDPGDVVNEDGEENLDSDSSDATSDSDNSANIRTINDADNSASADAADDTNTSGNTDSTDDTDGNNASAPDDSNSAADDESTPATPKVLTIKYSTSGLSAGAHPIFVVAEDLAGNRTKRSAVLLIDAPAVITGPDSSTIRVTSQELEDQDALAKKVLALYSASDPDGAFNNDGTEAEGNPTVTLSPDTQLVEGTNQVKIILTDASGRVSTRTVTIDLVRGAIVVPEIIPYIPRPIEVVPTPAQSGGRGIPENYPITPGVGSGITPSTGDTSVNNGSGLIESGTNPSDNSSASDSVAGNNSSTNTENSPSDNAGVDTNGGLTDGNTGSVSQNQSGINNSSFGQTQLENNSNDKATTNTVKPNANLNSNKPLLSATGTEIAGASAAAVLLFALGGVVVFASRRRQVR